MCIILLVADVNEPGCGRRGATQLDKYHDGGLTPSRDAATAATWVVRRCRGGWTGGRGVSTVSPPSCDQPPAVSSNWAEI